LEWCAGDHDYFSNVSFQQRDHEGNVEALRYLETPDWLIGFILRTRPVVFAVRRLIRRFAGRRSQT
jgi:hypothetical protein